MPIRNCSAFRSVADKFSHEVRSRIMSSIRGKDTMPEIKIRKLLWSMGKRYRIHDRRIFGTPDISNKEKQLAVFIDGCFWHGCQKCYREPKTNPSFWRSKILRNQRRRNVVKYELRKQGVIMLQFWEHDVLSNPIKVANKISKFL